jgi:threonyl-tRNA synthetase
MAKYDLDTVRHSTAHVMAQAIMRLWPEEKIQLGIGPTIENGFYYDILMDHRITEEDLKEIEKEMKTIINEDLEVSRKVFNSKREAREYFEKMGQTLKTELIDELPEDAPISCYTQGEFIDLCRGPHIERTGELSTHFKLLNTAGAYWRGDSTRPMLQRVYATCFDDRKKLKAHLNFLEEAKKRDHRKLARDLDLFLFDSHAPASPFFLPKGAFIRNELIAFLRRIYPHFGYQEVVTPQVLDVSLWHTSGHYENYKENMFFINMDDREFALKPMNCPIHMLIYKHKKFSYRDLPLRIADFGRIHRHEKSGTVGGMTRVWTFSQDDAHIFLPMEEVKDEIQRLIDMSLMIYEHFGFSDLKINLATRPDKKVGDDLTWDKAEAALEEALKSSGHKYEILEGDGAFYGPKIDFKVADAIKRYHQLATIQLDFQLPQRFDLSYVDKNGDKQRPVIIHRAILGSLERFFALLLEHVAGAFPFWLAPEQAVIVPVNDDCLEAANKLSSKLIKEGFRVRLDDRNESMGLKTRQCQTSKIPFMLVMGEREITDQSVSVRAYGERKSQVMPEKELFEKFRQLNDERIPKALRETGA